MKLTIERAALLKALGHEIYDPAEDEIKNLTPIEASGFRAWKHSDLPRFRRTINRERRLVVGRDPERVRGAGRPEWNDGRVGSARGLCGGWADAP